MLQAVKDIVWRQFKDKKNCQGRRNSKEHSSTMPYVKKFKWSHTMRRNLRRITNTRMAWYSYTHSYMIFTKEQGNVFESILCNNFENVSWYARMTLNQTIQLAFEMAQNFSKCFLLFRAGHANDAIWKFVVHDCYSAIENLAFCNRGIFIFVRLLVICLSNFPSIERLNRSRLPLRNRDWGLDAVRLAHLNLRLSPTETR